MGIGAAVSFGAFLFLLDVLAKLGVVDTVPPSIFSGVVVDAVFMVVVFGDIAGGYLEHIEVEVLNGTEKYLDVGRVMELVASLTDMGNIRESLAFFLKF